VRISKGRAWFVSAGGVRVWNERASLFQPLSVQESALWELIAGSVSPDLWPSVLAAAVGEGEGTGMPGWVAETLLSWRELGWLDEESRHG